MVSELRHEHPATSAGAFGLGFTCLEVEAD
jgi:hypothetical protein